MLDRIIQGSLNNRAIVLAVALVVGGYGLWSAASMPIDVLPDLNRPVVTVMAEAHGMIAEDVELLVTYPIEQTLNGATGVYRVRSSSGSGLSVIYAEFEWDVDIYRARQVVAEKLQLAREKLPEGVDPFLAPVSSIMGQVQVIGFRSEDPDVGATRLRLLVDRDIKPRIMALAGVAQVVTIGGAPTELQVIVDNDKLRTFGVTLLDVERAAVAANVNITAGTLTMGARGPTVSVPGRIGQERDLAEALVRPDPVRPVRIRDVAQVIYGPSTIRTGEAGVDGEPGVLMVVAKQPGADTVALTERVNGALHDAAAELPGGVKVVDDVFQQAAFIHRAIDNVIVAVRDGAILVIIVLVLFLMSVRTTLITLTAIPLSIAAAALVFQAFGITINTMTLGGLAVAIGMLVDDAIVDVENVYRRLHENAAREHPRPALAVVFQASSEIRGPVLNGTLLVTVVYMPLFFLSGIEGRLFAPVGLAYIVSVMASLVVAMTVTPVLCYLLLPRTQNIQREYGGWLVRAVRGAAERAVRLGVRQPVAVTGVILAMFVSCAVIFATRGSSFLPEFNEGSFQVNLTLDPDASLDTSHAFGSRLEEVLLSIDGINHVGRRTGRAGGDEHIMPVSVSEAVITIDPDSGRSREDLIRDIRDRMEAEFPGVLHTTEQPLKHLLDHLLSGVTASVAIKISGPDLRVLRRVASDVEQAVSSVDGVRDLFMEPQVLVDQVEVRPRREALAARGLTVTDVAETVELAMGGHEVSRVQMGQVSYPIVIRVEAEDRADLHKLRALYVRDPQGRLIPLEDVAEVGVARTPHSIERENVRRRVVVQHNVEGRPLSDVVRDVERVLAPIRASLAETGGGFSIDIGGQFEAQEQASRVIALLGILAVGLMVMILYTHLRSLKLSLLILLSRPIAFIGAVIVVVATGQDVSIATLVGLIALLGVSTRNAILLVDHYLFLMRESDMGFGLELLVRAGRERAVPVIMTALTSAIGLVPLALSAGQPGREILYPVASVVVGGLFTSTLLDFLITPALTWMFGRKETERLTGTADLQSATRSPSA